MSDAKIKEELSDELDKALLKGIQEGVEVPTEDGVVTIAAPAAFLNVARQRLKDLGISKVVTPGSDLARLAAEIGKARGQPVNLRELNEEPDAATDGIERLAAE